MLDELRDRMNHFLDSRQVAVLSAWGWGQPWALPVQYHRQGQVIDCLLPAWSDLLSLLDEDPRLHLVIPDETSNGNRWLQVKGTARRLAAPDWSDWQLPGAAHTPPKSRYTVIRITPQRIDLFDESRGWGFRETLDC